MRSRNDKNVIGSGTMRSYKIPQMVIMVWLNLLSKEVRWTIAVQEKGDIPMTMTSGEVICNQPMTYTKLYCPADDTTYILKLERQYKSSSGICPPSLPMWGLNVHIHPTHAWISAQALNASNRFSFKRTENILNICDNNVAKATSVFNFILFDKFDHTLNERLGLKFLNEIKR